MKDYVRFFDERLRESCEDLFRSMSIPAWLVSDGAQPPARARQIATTVGFQGWQIRGALAIRADAAFFRESHPMAGKGSASEQATLDWAGELGNQLLGRIKNRLLAYGVEFQVAAPSTTAGDALAETRTERDRTVGCIYRTAGHFVRACLSVHVSPGVTFDETPTGRTALGPGRAFDL